MTFYTPDFKFESIGSEAPRGWLNFQETSQKLWHIFCYYKTVRRSRLDSRSTFFESNERRWSNTGPTCRRSITKNRSFDLSELTPIETTLAPTFFRRSLDTKSVRIYP